MAAPVHPDRYKWTVLVNTTLGVFMALLNTSIVIISLPAIFRGIDVNPLQASNIGLLLWLLQGYMIVTAVLVVTLGRIGDIFGRVRMYNAGFAVFTVASIALAVSPVSGPSGAMVLIGLRIVQGVGGALLMANSMAIITDAFPLHQRGMALGINIVAGISGSFLGLLVGGLLSAVNWRWVFLVSVPFGVAGTVWAYLKLRDTGVRTTARIDWWGNATFAAGLVLIMVGLTYGLMPAGGHSMGWTSPWVVSELGGGVAMLLRVRRRRAPGAGPDAGPRALPPAGVHRGGCRQPALQHGPRRPAVHAGVVVAGHLASAARLFVRVDAAVVGHLHGALCRSATWPRGRWPVGCRTATGRSGSPPWACSGRRPPSWCCCLLPIDFPYPAFAVIVLGNGVFVGLFSAPNTTTMMNAVPAHQRGAASGMRATFMNSGFVLSIGIFFSLMIVGLAATLPGGDVARPAGARGAHRRRPTCGVAARRGHAVRRLPGLQPHADPARAHVLAQVGPAHAAVLTGQAVFPLAHLGPFPPRPGGGLQRLGAVVRGRRRGQLVGGQPGRSRGRRRGGSRKRHGR